MFYGTLNPASQTMDVTVVRPENFTLNESEKNWCPFVKNGKVFVVYSFFPELVILRKTDQNTHEKVFSEKSPYLHSWVKQNIDFSKARHIGGGSNFLEYREHFVGIFHVKYFDFEFSSFMVFFTPDFVIRDIVAIDYGDTLFQGQRLKRLKTELNQDETDIFFVGGYRRSLEKVAFPTGLFLKNDKFHISLGVNDLVTKVAVIGKEKIDEVINNISRCSPSAPRWETPSIEIPPVV